MPLEEFFRSRSALVRFRLPPLGPALDAFSQWLGAYGHTRKLIRRHVWKTAQFNAYLRRRGIKECREIDRRLAERFISNHLDRSRRGECCRSDHRATAGAVRSCLNFLSERGLITPPVPERLPYQPLLDEYLEYLRAERNLADSSIAAHRRFLIGFIDGFGEQAVLHRLAALSAEDVQRFFAKHAKDARPSICRDLQGSLRSFLRFCTTRGYVTGDLAQAIPRIRTYRLSNTPRGVRDDEAQKLIAFIDRTTAVGLRDYAILQLLYMYGVRGGQIRALRLLDIQWRQNRICFPTSKGGKTVAFPLTEQVGEGLLAYLRHGRPQVPYPEVFLTAHAPYRPLRNPSVLSCMVARRMRQAAVTSPIRGSHAFRHAFAARMLAHGQSLKAIADMLGHRAIATTLIYTKVDLGTLRLVPLDWPEVSS